MYYFQSGDLSEFGDLIFDSGILVTARLSLEKIKKHLLSIAGAVEVDTHFPCFLSESCSCKISLQAYCGTAVSF